MDLARPLPTRVIDRKPKTRIGDRTTMKLTIKIKASRRQFSDEQADVWELNVQNYITDRGFGAEVETVESNIETQIDVYFDNQILDAAELNSRNWRRNRRTTARELAGVLCESCQPGGDSECGSVGTVDELLRVTLPLLHAHAMYVADGAIDAAS